MNLKQHIPNLLTLGNLLCGCLGLLVVTQTPEVNWEEWSKKPPKFTFFHPWNEIKWASLLLICGLILDFFDGFVARLLNVSSPIGKQLDSLADQVTFGVLPGFIMFYTIQQFGFVNSIENYTPSGYITFLPFIAFLIPAFAALRLAKFNIDTEQTNNFKGLATPSVGLFIVGLTHLYVSTLPNGWITKLITPLSLSGIILFLSFMMVSSIPLFGFKFKNFSWKDNWFRFVLIGLAIPLLIWLKLAALPIIILIYILLSIIFKKHFVEVSEQQ